VNYDIQDSFQDKGTGKWSEPQTEKLRPAGQLPPPSGKYFTRETALPQPMRFRVRAVRLDNSGNEITSDWTDWIVSQP